MTLDDVRARRRALLGARRRSRAVGPVSGLPTAERIAPHRRRAAAERAMAFFRFAFAPPSAPADPDARVCCCARRG